MVGSGFTISLPPISSTTHAPPVRLAGAPVPPSQAPAPSASSAIAVNEMAFMESSLHRT